MAQIRSSKILFFCFFSAVTAENVYPQAMHSYGMRLLCESKKYARIRGVNGYSISKVYGIMAQKL